MIVNFLIRFLKGDRNKMIYCHNLRANGHFLLNVLGKYSLSKIKIIREEGGLVSFDVYKNGFGSLEFDVLSQINVGNLLSKRWTTCLRFRDSSLFLPMSLKELYGFYQVPYMKELVFLNSEEDQSFEMIGINFYNWIYVQKEIINSLELECRGLYQVLDLFKNYIFKLGQVDITKVHSLSGVAFKLFRREMVTDLYRLTRIEDSEIRRGYYTENAEVFLSYAKGSLYLYNINLLYGSCMLEDMPIGKPIEYSVEEVLLDSFFGFVECTVFCPSTIKYPILSIKTDGEDSRVVGTLRGLWFSEEIKYALSVGYEIVKIHKGVGFERGKLFSEFVTKYQEAHLAATSLVEKLFVELILNNLCKGLGINPWNYIHSILFETELIELTKKYEILKSCEICSNNSIKRYEVILSMKPCDGLKLINLEEYKMLLQSYNGLRSLGNVSVSAAISSYGRIRRYEIFNNFNGQVCYTDTDSFVTTVPLSESKIKGLGELKLKGEFEEGYFLASGNYGLKAVNGDDLLIRNGVRIYSLKYEDYAVLYEKMSLL